MKGQLAMGARHSDKMAGCLLRPIAWLVVSLTGGLVFVQRSDPAANLCRQMRRRDT